MFFFCFYTDSDIHAFFLHCTPDSLTHFEAISYYAKLKQVAQIATTVVKLVHTLFCDVHVRRIRRMAAFLRQQLVLIFSLMMKTGLFVELHKLLISSE